MNEVLLLTQRKNDEWGICIAGATLSRKNSLKINVKSLINVVKCFVQLFSFIYETIVSVDVWPFFEQKRQNIQMSAYGVKGTRKQNEELQTIFKAKPYECQFHYENYFNLSKCFCIRLVFTRVRSSS